MAPAVLSCTRRASTHNEEGGGVGRWVGVGEASRFDRLLAKMEYDGLVQQASDEAPRRKRDELPLAKKAWLV